MKHLPLPHGSIRSSIKTSVVGASVGLIGGIWLQYVDKDLLPITPLLLALPAMGALAGDLATVVTAHTSDPETSDYTRRRLNRTLMMVIPFNAVGVVSLSLFLAWLQDYEITRSFTYRYSLFVATVFALVVLVTLFGGNLLNKALTMKRINADDLLIPLANITASVLVLLSISLAVWTIF